MQFEPTIIQKIKSISDNNIYVKRDDLLPFCFGGNKLRISYEFLKDMKAQNKNCIIGFGGVKSNFCRILSNLCAANDIECFIISPNENPDNLIKSFNNDIVNKLGAKVFYCKNNDVGKTIDEVMKLCIKKGLKPYYIKGNRDGYGNEHIYPIAYKKVYSEILKQSKELGIKFDYIFVTTGTGWTQAGLLVGQYSSKEKIKIVGISAARKKEVEIPIIKSYVEAYFKKLVVDYEPINEKIVLYDKQLCGGYGLYDKNIENTVNSMLKNNGIPLDYTYTGKGFTGMLEYLKENNLSNLNVLFIHTGGLPLFFDTLK